MSLSTCDTDIAPTVLQYLADFKPEYINIHGKTSSIQSKTCPLLVLITSCWC